MVGRLPEKQITEGKSGELSLGLATCESRGSTREPTRTRDVQNKHRRPQVSHPVNTEDLR